MSPKLFFCVLLLQLIKISSASSSEQEYIVLKEDKLENNCEGHSIENNIKKYIDDLKKLVEDKLETLQTDMEDTINQKLHKLERRIVDRLRDIDTKIEDMNTSTPKIVDVEINPDLKKISQIEDNCNRKIDSIENKILEICLKLDYTDNIIKDNSLILSAIKNATIDNPQTLNTLSYRIEKLQNTTDIHYECSQEKSSILNISSTLERLLDITNDSVTILSELKASSNNCTHLLNDSQKMIPNEADQISLHKNTTSDVLPETDKCSTRMNFNEINKPNWLHCKEENVANSRPIWGNNLYSIENMAGNCNTNGDSSTLLLHVGFLGDRRMSVVLSPAPLLTYSSSGPHFYLVAIDKTEAILYEWIKNAGTATEIKKVYFNLNPSYDQATGYVFKISNETLEVRHDNSSTAILVHHDADIAQLKYFGFETFYNSRGHATFLFDC